MGRALPFTDPKFYPECRAVIPMGIIRFGLNAPAQWLAHAADLSLHCWERLTYLQPTQWTSALVPCPWSRGRHKGWLAGSSAQQVLFLLLLGRRIARRCGICVHKFEVIWIEAIIPALIPVTALEFQEAETSGLSLAALRGQDLEGDMRNGAALIIAGVL